MKRFLLSFIIIVLVGVFILPFGVKAATPESILTNIVPANPAPFENTTITLNSYEDDLNTVSISWSVNGKNVSSGIGDKTFSINAPDATGQTTIIADIALPDGNIEKKIVIKPTVMTLLWQANDSYVPPFYKGKALPSVGSQIKVVAIPEIKINSKIVNPKSMIYNWQQDFTNNTDASGYGKNYYVYTNDYLEDSNNVLVNATTIDQNYSATANIYINGIQPQILFYRNDLKLGTIWDQTLKDGYKIQNSDVLVAAPYFISPKDIRIPLLNWVWSINDNAVSVTNTKSNFLPLRVQEGTSGTSKIDLQINNISKIFESASGEINVKF